MAWYGIYYVVWYSTVCDGTKIASHPTCPFAPLKLGTLAPDHPLVSSKGGMYGVEGALSSLVYDCAWNEVRSCRPFYSNTGMYTRSFTAESHPLIDIR